MENLVPNFQNLVIKEKNVMIFQLQNYLQFFASSTDFIPLTLTFGEIFKGAEVKNRSILTAPNVFDRQKKKKTHIILGFLYYKYKLRHLCGYADRHNIILKKKNQYRNLSHSIIFLLQLNSLLTFYLQQITHVIINRSGKCSKTQCTKHSMPENTAPSKAKMHLNAQLSVIASKVFSSTDFTTGRPITHLTAVTINSSIGIIFLKHLNIF
ncbi:hypothetical protein AGLY_012922 [Aphis glycines]|uniref:Uncharacterized protein n=1 Tax=Aphis glycines TaxID=307491 RepID=A0A6G0T786_APHGL|nr:hypothetical protein AGLY_012922 [Aphis glycines]